MKLRLRPRIFSWGKVCQQERTYLKKKPFAPKGMLSFSLSFFFFLGLGICILLLTQIHLRVGGIRRNLLLTNYAAENGLKMSYLFLREKLESSAWPLFLSEPEAEFIANSEPAEMARWLLNRHFALDFPVFLESTWKSMAWKSELSSQVKEIESFGQYVLATTQIRSEAEGKIVPFFQRAKGEFRLDVALAAGYLPLPLFPFLLEKQMGSTEQTEYLRFVKISPESSTSFNPAARPFFSPEKIISRDIIPFLEKGLKIRLFKPDNINPLVLRKALGLEMSREPVPEGVYLINDDMGLGGVFVQGNLDELFLAIDGPYQILFFRQGDKTSELRFNPTLGQTVFSSPVKSTVYEGLPNGIVLVNGAINTLGRGEISLSGDVFLATEEPKPCVLPGTRLTLVASGEINIVSPIVLSSVNLQPGIPYLRQRQNQVLIFSSGKDLVTQEEVTAGLNLKISNGEEMVVEADLLALGNGIQVEGKNKRAVIQGSLQATEINPNSNLIEIIPHENPYLLAREPEGLPLTSRPLSIIIQFRPTQWIDNAKDK